MLYFNFPIFSLFPKKWLTLEKVLWVAEKKGYFLLLRSNVQKCLMGSFTYHLHTVLICFVFVQMTFALVRLKQWWQTPEVWILIALIIKAQSDTGINVGRSERQSSQPLKISPLGLSAPKREQVFLATPPYHFLSLPRHITSCLSVQTFRPRLTSG